MIRCLDICVQVFVTVFFFCFFFPPLLMGLYSTKFEIEVIITCAHNRHFSTEAHVAFTFDL